MRTAISPRLAMSTLRNGLHSGMLPCFLGGFLSRLVRVMSRPAMILRRVGAGLDHLVHEAAVGGHVGVRELLAELRHLLRAQGRGVRRRGQLAAVEDVHRAFRAHDRDLRRGIGEVQVGADVLAGHDAVRAAVGLARDHRDLGHGGLGEGVEQLGPVADDPAELLGGAGQEAGHVLEGHERDVEGVAEAHEAGPLHARRRCPGSPPGPRAGWPRCPTLRPPKRAKPTTMLGA